MAMDVEFTRCVACRKPLEPGEEMVDAEGITHDVHQGQCAIQAGRLNQDQVDVLRHVKEIETNQHWGRASYYISRSLQEYPIRGRVKIRRTEGFDD